MTTVGAIERRLADLRHEAAGVHRGARTNVVELVVWAGNNDLADEAANAIAGLTHNRPSRALVLEPAALQHVTADESVFCALPPDGGGGVLVCSEVVRLRGPADTEALPSMARSLMLPNLPLFVLWLDEPRFDGPIAKGILRGATRLVVDSTRFPAVLPALPALAGDEPPYIADLSWTKITGWRDVVAQLFDPPAHRELLPSLREIRIAHVAGTDSQAVLLAGWLRSHVASDAAVELGDVVRNDMRPGSIVHVDLVCGDAVLSVDRPMEGVAVTRSPALGEQRLQLRVPPFADLLADELEFLTRDRVFEAALDASLAVADDLWR